MDDYSKKFLVTEEGDQKRNDVQQAQKNPDWINEDIVFASLGLRIGAYIIDGVILFIPSLIAEMVVFQMESFSEPRTLKNHLFTTLVWALYYGATESSAKQATFGKRILGIYSVNEFGQNLSFGKAALRSISMIISLIPLGFGFWTIASRKNKTNQGWHDMMLGTYVLKRKSKKPESQLLDDELMSKESEND